MHGDSEASLSFMSRLKKPLLWRFLHRQLVVFLLGFASGLPLALTGGTLAAWYTVSGASTVTIASLAVLGTPYIYKFLWAPLMDRYSLPCFGRRRGWIFATQMILVVAIAGMAWGDPHTAPYFLIVLAALVSFSSASQDVAIDAYRAELLPAAERGIGAAVTSAGYRVAMMVSGAFALIWAQHIGWHNTYLLLAACMLVASAVTLICPELQRTHGTPQTLKEAVIEPFREFLSRPYALSVLAFIFFFKITEAFTANAGGLINLFFLRELSLSLEMVGILNKILGLSSLIVGIFVGGVVLARSRLSYAMLVFVVLQAVTNLGYYFLAQIGHPMWLLAGVVICDNFAAGLGNAAIIALLMKICDRRYTATQFAALTALAVVGRVVLVPIAGYLIEYAGWPLFFVSTFLVGLPAIPLLLRIQKYAPEWFAG